MSYTLGFYTPHDRIKVATWLDGIRDLTKTVPLGVGELRLAPDKSKHAENPAYFNVDVDAPFVLLDELEHFYFWIYLCSDKWVYPDMNLKSFFVDLRQRKNIHAVMALICTIAAAKVLGVDEIVDSSAEWCGKGSGRDTFSPHEPLTNLLRNGGVIGPDGTLNLNPRFV
jgi:hypothetical protein